MFEFQAQTPENTGGASWAFGRSLRRQIRRVPVISLLLLSAGSAWAVDVPFSAKQVIDTELHNAVAIRTADMDGDGDLDVLDAAVNSGISWWENADGAGTSWTEHPIDGNFVLTATAFPADIDGDGDLDVLSARFGFAPTPLTWSENLNGAGTSWTKHMIDGDFLPFGVGDTIYAADVDGDGDLDVIGADSRTQDTVWWENVTGTGTSWTLHTIDSDFSGIFVSPGDLDGDGDVDVLGSGENTWWENLDGAGTNWTAHSIDSDPLGARSVRAADVDGDGDLDVLAARSSADDILWWENLNGAGTAWSAHMIDGNFDGAWSVLGADLDGDGDLDVLGTAIVAGDLTW